MKKTASLLLLLLLYGSTEAQEQRDYQRLPSRFSCSISVDFQGFTLPFSPLRTYWRNKGVSFSAAYKWNRKGSWQQVVRAGTFFNPYHGGTHHVSTALQYNPVHSRTITAGLSVGAGYLHTGSVSGGWKQEVDGTWKSGPNKQGVLFVPATVHLSIKAMEKGLLRFSPMHSYGVNALLHYTPASPVVPQTLLSIGSKINFNK